jgi:hypothetical protein
MKNVETWTDDKMHNFYWKVRNAFKIDKALSFDVINNVGTRLSSSSRFITKDFDLKEGDLFLVKMSERS